MKCPKCQAENPEESRFCGGGLSLELEVICPHCGARRPTGFNFCNKCGDDLKESTKTTRVSVSEPTPPLDDKFLSTASETCASTPAPALDDQDKKLRKEFGE